MTVYISMLRGINVGGHKTIKMPDLVALYESLGFQHILTYVQSGNVIFDTSERDAREIPNLIEEKIARMFKFKVAVLLRTPDELRQIIQDNPFMQEKGIDVGKLHVTLLSDIPAEPGLKKVSGLINGADKFVVVNREVYLYCPNGYGGTKLSNDFFERKLAVAATTRNWKTVNALLNMAKS
jgi:uncharacterized protein (DUF1697 family)